MPYRAAAFVALALAACGTEAAPPPEPERVAHPAEEATAPSEPESMSVEEAMQASARWLATPPPVDAATFDPDAFEWRVVPGMERLARDGAPRVTIVARTTGGGTACSGGMCSTSLDARALRGTLPSGHLGYFASMRPPDDHLCEGASPDALFADWTIAEIAPRADGEAPLHCGIHAHDGHDDAPWVILKVSTGPRVQ